MVKPSLIDPVNILRSKMNYTPMNFTSLKELRRTPSALFLLSMAMVVSVHLAGQSSPSSAKPAQPPAKNSPEEFIEILYSGVFESITIGKDTIVKLQNEVELRHGDVYLFCDSAMVKNKTFLIASGNFILKQGDSTTVFSDSATYIGTEKVADLYGNVAMIQGSRKLFTEQLTYDTKSKIATYNTGATIADDSIFITSKVGYYHVLTDMMYFKDSVRVISPDFSLKTDSLNFDTKNKIAYFLKPVLITLDSAMIYTERGFYDIQNKKAQFIGNPQFQKNDLRAWARAIVYDGLSGDVSFLVDAHFEDSDTKASAQYIRHNENTQQTILADNVFFRVKNRTITGDSVFYDARQGTYASRGRSTIVDGTKTLQAEFVDYDKKQDVGIASGNVIWQDSTEKLTVFCEYAEHAADRNYLKASGGKYGRPLLMKVIDEDTLYLSADTLLSFETVPPDTTTVSDADTTERELTKTDRFLATDTSASDTIQPLFLLPDSTGTDSIAQQLEADAVASGADTVRTILAYHDVRIFKSDLQALCDSLSYSSADSIFRMFQRPVLWSDSSQFTADTVLMQLANDQIDKVLLRQNTFIANSSDEVFFNQISGRNSVANFEDGQLRTVRVVGNAESVYYALDDEDAYIGVNKAACSEILLYFADDKVDGIVFYTQPQASLMPMKNTDHEALKLKGFNWRFGERPKKLEDILQH